MSYLDWVELLSGIAPVRQECCLPASRWALEKEKEIYTEGRRREGTIPRLWWVSLLTGVRVTHHLHRGHTHTGHLFPPVCLWWVPVTQWHTIYSVSDNFYNIDNISAEASEVVSTHWNTSPTAQCCYLALFKVFSDVVLVYQPVHSFKQWNV